MHVVDMRHAQERRQQNADEPGLFMRMDRVVAGSESAPDDGQCQQKIEWNLRERWPHPDTANKGRPPAAKQSKPVHRHVASERISDEIDLMPELSERSDAMELAERRAARLEERLGRNHQKAHGAMIFSRIRSTLCRLRNTSSMSEEQPPRP